MKKLNYSVTRNGKPLDKSLYTLDLDKKIFASEEDNLVLDFAGINRWNFNTRYGCAFNTGSYCTFTTSSICTFKTGSYCTFNTHSGCVFNTGSDCTFKTGSYCTFHTSSDCAFKTGSGCAFNTVSGCTFHTSSDCAFRTGSYCTFITGPACALVTWKPSRYFLDESHYVLDSNYKLIEIKDKNSALLNCKHPDKTVRDFCNEIIKG